MKKFIREHTSISILKQNMEVFYNLAIKVALCIYWNLHIFKKLSNELSVNIESQINLLSGKKFTFSNKRPGNSLPFPDGQVDNIPSSQQQAPNHQQVSVGMHLLSHPWGSSRCVRECTSSPTSEDPAGVWGSAPTLPPVRIQQFRPSCQRLFWPPKTHPSILPTLTNAQMTCWPQNRSSTRLKTHNKKTLSPVSDMTLNDFECHRDCKGN